MTKTPLQEAFDLVSTLSKRPVNKRHIDILTENLEKKLFVPTNGFFGYLINEVHKRVLNNTCDYEMCSNLIHKIINGYDDVDIPNKLFDIVLFDQNTWQKNMEFLLAICARKNKIFSLDAIMIYSKKRVCFADEPQLINILDKPEHFKLFIAETNNIDETIVNIMFKYNFKNGIIKLINNMARIDDPYISHCVRNGNAEAVTLLNSKGYHFTNLHLRLACECGDTDTIKIILNQKVTSDDVCIQNLCTHKQDLDKARQNIELLLSYGYVVTKDDLLLITDSGVIIDEKFVPKQFFDNQIFMKKLATACNNNTIFAYGIKPTTDSLVALIRKKKPVAEIKNFIKTKGIEPDIACLREACKYASYKSVLRLLIETYKLELDYECLVNCLGVYNGNQTTYIVDKARDVPKKSRQI